MKCFVTGGAGFVGSHLVDELMKEHSVTVYDNLSLGREELIRHHLNKEEFRFIKADLLDFEALKKSIKGARVGVLGLAYKANVDDIRESPAFDIINLLNAKGADVFVFDPHVKKGINVKNLDELLNKSDYIVLATEHNEFRNIDLNQLKKHKILVVIDGRNCLDKEKIKSMGILYHGIGRR